MIFNTASFVIFFIIVITAYFLIPHRFRWILLLASSYYFYMFWKPEYIILILISTAIDYFASIKMGETEDKKKRKKYLYLSLLSNLGMLFAFKYFGLFNNTFRAIFTKLNIPYGIPAFKILVPMGISFYTFQTLSYTIDVYRGDKKPEKHFGIFALYVSFFPQLVAGPIERSERLLPQFYEKHKFDYYRVTDGLKRMLWGLFKKIVIADRLAILVKHVYESPTEYTGVPLVIATVFFAFQIYCDFSGYSDIAIGSAKVMGFDLMENFNRPYFSKSISEFWRRWHISLSSWFKDYLYIPLGGNRVSKVRTYFNLFFTFLISGLWHGSAWHYVVWGALHGMYLIVGKIIYKPKQKLIKALKLNKVPIIHKTIEILITFTLVCFAWIFFVANSLTDAIYVVKHIPVGLTNAFNLEYMNKTIFTLGLDQKQFTIAICSIIFMELVHFVERRGNIIETLREKPTWFRWAYYYIIITCIFMFGVFGGSEFIYFQF